MDLRYFFLFLLGICGCSGFAPHVRNESGDPDARLGSLLADLDRARVTSPRHDVIDGDESVFIDSGHLRNEFERLGLEFPNHARIQAANAQIANDAGEREKAELYAERALALDPADPDSAALRARLLAESGNLAAASALLVTAVERRPDHFLLRETEAAIAFASDDSERAKSALLAAERLGAPRWRIEYHRGLLAERGADRVAARAHYEAVLKECPEHEPTIRRLRGLDALP